MIAIILVVSILAGELIKLPFFGVQGPVLLDFVIIFLTILGFFDIKFKFKKPNLFFKAGFIFIFFAILSLLLTPLNLSMLEYLISFSYIVRLSFYLLFSYLIYSGAFLNFKKRIPQVLLISGTGLAILGLLQFSVFSNLEFLQYFGWDPHYFRTVSTFLDPNFTGAFLCLTMLILYQNLTMVKKWYVITFLTIFLAFLTTFSRSGYIMFLISGVIFSILKKSKKIFFATIILFLILILGFYFYTSIVAQPRGIDRKQSASYRINTWQNGINIFQKTPILGVGFNAYKYAIREYHLADQQFLSSRGSSTNDSSLLYVLATTGIIGLLSFILFLFSFFKTSVKNHLLVAGLLGLIFHSFFANSLFYPFILIWVLLKAIDTNH